MCNYFIFTYFSDEKILLFSIIHFISESFVANNDVDESSIFLAALKIVKLSFRDKTEIIGP